MRLYLCRHAEAVDSSGDPPLDDERWLTTHGRDQVRKVGKALRRDGIGFDAIFTSPLVRAVQTAEGLAHALQFEEAIGVLRPLGPGGSLGHLLSQLAGSQAQDVALVGHEPQMSEWGARLLGVRDIGRPFKKGAVLGIEWPGIPEAGTGQALFYMTPKSLAREAL